MAVVVILIVRVVAKNAVEMFVTLVVTVFVKVSVIKEYFASGLLATGTAVVADC